MSEKLHHSPEHHRKSIDTSAESERNRERIENAAKKAEKAADNIDQLTQHALEQAISGEEISPAESQTESQSPIGLHQELKSNAYAKTLRQVQKSLSPASRTFSKFVHKPAVERISNLGAATVARPSGIISGGLFALIGTTVVLYMARKYGFTYNNLCFLFCLLAGSQLAY